VSVPIGDEAVAEETLGLGSVAGCGGSGGKKERAPRDEGTVHKAILIRGGQKARLMLSC
jgi:hypothetical protein